jgi:hypothetical protein
LGLRNSDRFGYKVPSLSPVSDRKFMSDPLVHVLLFVAMATTTDTAELRNQNLLMTRPDEYKADFYEKTTDMLTSEMVPADQSVSDWTQLLRTQIFLR